MRPSIKVKSEKGASTSTISEVFLQNYRLTNLQNHENNDIFLRIRYGVEIFSMLHYSKVAFPRVLCSIVRLVQRSSYDVQTIEEQAQRKGQRRTRAMKTEDRTPSQDETERKQPYIFQVRNHHHASCGVPPRFDDSNEVYLSYYESQFGGQNIFVYAYETKEAFLYRGDTGWERPRKVIEGGRVPGLTCDEYEAMWRFACWTATHSSETMQMPTGRANKRREGWISMLSNNQESNAIPHCTFCGQSQDQVSRLIAGPGGVNICGECVDLYRESIEKMAGKPITMKKLMQVCGSCETHAPATHHYCFNCGSPFTQETRGDIL
jgi:hypothetical protein